MSEAADADMSPVDHGGEAPWGLPRRVARLPWVGWALSQETFALALGGGLE